MNSIKGSAIYPEIRVYLLGNEWVARTYLRLFINGKWYLEHHRYTLMHDELDLDRYDGCDKPIQLFNTVTLSIYNSQLRTEEINLQLLDMVDAVYHQPLLLLDENQRDETTRLEDTRHFLHQYDKPS